MAQSFTGQVIEVLEGDILRVERGGDPVTIHLYGLDAPEPDQPFGSTATDFVRRQIEGQEVRVQIRDRDRFGRLVATVHHDGAELNAQLLRAGLAWYYWSYDRYTAEAAQDQTLEYRAQRARRGLWGQSTPIPPWDWRDYPLGAG